MRYIRIPQDKVGVYKDYFDDRKGRELKVYDEPQKIDYYHEYTYDSTVPYETFGSA